MTSIANLKIYHVWALGLALALPACGGDDSDRGALSAHLVTLLEAQPDGLEGFLIPDPSDLAQIPQDPSNPLTPEKVELGRLLFHETGLALAGKGNEPGRWSCASCHHAPAGFKSGIPQGIGEGGTGFGAAGEGRTLDPAFDPTDPDRPQPDLQPVTSPAVLNVAYQSVMAWNGQFGHTPDGPNAGLAPSVVAPPEGPLAANRLGLAGVETQAIAGLGVHQQSVEDDSPLQTNPTYQELYRAAFPEGGDALENAGKAIAAFERTVLADRAPFQRWLRGAASALGPAELRGAILFFGSAGCVGCHTGPALSSRVGATAEAMFFAVGFADLDPADPRVHGPIGEEGPLGRGGFTGAPADDGRFKVPQLYNLLDTDVLGHGASFSRVREVVSYKNRAVSQAGDPRRMAEGFVPLGLTIDEIDDLTAFIERGLYDPELARYVPSALPTGACFPNADAESARDLACISSGTRD